MIGHLEQGAGARSRIVNFQFRAADQCSWWSWADPDIWRTLKKRGKSRRESYGPPWKQRCDL